MEQGQEKVLHVKAAEFDDIIASEKPVFVDFWAPWCGPCRMIGPFIEQLAEEFDGKAVVCKLNVDEEPELAGRFSVASIPTLILFKDGEIVNTSVGVRPKATIEAMIR